VATRKTTSKIKVWKGSCFDKSSESVATLYLKYCNTWKEYCKGNLSININKTKQKNE
jgi:hypothetical protein